MECWSIGVLDRREQTEKAKKEKSLLRSTLNAVKFDDLILFPRNVITGRGKEDSSVDKTVHFDMSFIGVSNTPSLQYSITPSRIRP